MPNLPDLDQLSPAQKDELIRALWQQVHEFTAHITVLQETKKTARRICQAV
ncbi:MAG: hypothetical protein JSS31_13915 [Proteobacteria bacterium]|nr:hypothetical protein [Pseudomonadota bacterium]MBS0495017.1 hypothetical protein [Pseudomonadota bacterium]